MRGEEEEKYQYRPMWRRRAPSVYRPLVNLETMVEGHIIVTYGLNRTTIHDLCALLDPILRPANRNQHAIPTEVQVLSVLNFLTTGSFQVTVGMGAGFSQPMFSLILSKFLDAFVQQLQTYVKFPQSAELPAIKSELYAFANIPHLIGAIDGTQIAFIPPRVNEQVYRNRKNFHSMNMQLVCTADQYISHVNARFTGSVHDSFVLRNSSVPHMMEQLQGDRGWLIGDSGYPSLQWLLTPVRNPRTDAERNYIAAHGRTRRVIERTIGLLNAIFR